MKHAAAIALATCLPSALSAGQAFGSWCNEHGDVLLIDEKGMRGGEHVNRVTGPPRSRTPLKSARACTVKH